MESTTEMSSAFYIYHICITILVLWYIGILPQQQQSAKQISYMSDPKPTEHTVAPIG